MIIIRLLGGLGNQIFQYCLGRRLAVEYDVPLRFDVRLMHDRESGTHSLAREFSLDVFEAPVQFAANSDVIRYSAWGFPRWVRGVLRATGMSSTSRQTIEQRFGFDPQILQCGASAYLSGLWQSIEYFSSIEDQIRSELKFRDPLVGPSRTLSEQILRGDSVCLHVRRTDFLKTSQLGFVGGDYYVQAVARMLGHYPRSEFFVFSDDLDWCREFFGFIPQVTYVGEEHAGRKDGGHLQLMSLCRRFIIPNSTFSWWAAWLSRSPEKVVYLPETWFRDPDLDASGLYIDGWQPIAIETFAE